MTLKLRESKAISDLAEVLYDFLPGSGNSQWSGHVTFRSVADELGLGHFWQRGSKTPMIVGLLSKTLESERGKFEPLLLQIVRKGITYRQRNNNPITANEIDQINGLLLELEFKFPEFWDPEFKDSLQFGRGNRARDHVDQAIQRDKARSTKASDRSKELDQLKQQFFELYSSLDRQDAGYKLESILNCLFDLHGLAPREPFRVVGEQIDGSFDLDHETYLLEAKWEKSPCSENPLLVFRGKIEGKSQFTRGVFVSINGISEKAKTAITLGKQPNFFAIDGHDLTMLLADSISLIDFFRRRRRLLAEEGKVSAPYTDLVST